MKILLTVILIITVFNLSAQTTDSIKVPLTVNTDSVYAKVDEEAKFPGGDEKWNKYVQSKIAENLSLLITDPASNGICTVKFIVDTDGNISSAIPINMQKSELAKIFITTLIKGPKWIPAKINGINVKSIKLQKVTFRTG